MTVERSEPSGLVVIKVRLRAGDSAPGLLATLMSTLDLTLRQEQHATATSVAETVAIVERWLEAFLHTGEGDEAVT